MPFLAGFVTPQDYGAKGDGVTDDTAAIQAAINAVFTGGGGTLFFPPATYAVTPVSSTSAALVLNNGTTGYNGVRMVGSSAGGSHIKKLANGPIFAMAGPSTDTSGNTHCKYCSIEHLYLDGNSLTGTMIQCYYADNLHFQNVHVMNNYDVVLDTAEFWDSRFYSMVCEDCGSLTNSASTPNMLLRNSAAASGFGFSADSVNQIYFIGCRWEDFRQGAVWIQQGVGNSSNPLGIFFTDCKMESSFLRGGPHLSVDTSSRGIFVDHLYCYSGGFGGTFNTPQDVISWSPNGFSALNNVVIANRASTTTVANGVTVNSPTAGQNVSVKNVAGLYLTAPTGAHINFGTTTGGFDVRNCTTLAGTNFSTAPSSTVDFPLEVSFSNATSAFKYPGNIVSQPTATGNTILSSNLTGTASFDNFRITGAGTLAMGPGTTARDVQVARTAIGNLSITNPLTSHGAVEIVDGNVVIGGTATLGDNGVGEIQLTNAPTVPTTNPTGGASLYATGGVLGFRSSTGFAYDLSNNVTTSTSTSTTVTGVTAITALANGSTVAANALAAGQVYKVKAWGILSTTVDTQTITWNLMWGGTGGTSLLTWGASNPDSSAFVTNVAWSTDYDIVANSATSLAVTGTLCTNYFFASMTEQITAVTNTSSEQLVLAITPSATAVSVTCHGFYFERVH